MQERPSEFLGIKLYATNRHNKFFLTEQEGEKYIKNKIEREITEKNT